MSFWSAMVAIVAILAFSRARMMRYRGELPGHDHWNHRPGNPHSALDPHLPSPRESELQREVDDLRERVKVLERIATDDRHSKAIAAEIESLRDT